MNATRPKSSLSKRANKAKAKVRKVVLLVALHEARYGKKVEKAKAAPRSRKIPKKVAAAAAAKKTKTTKKTSNTAAKAE